MFKSIKMINYQNIEGNITQQNIFCNICNKPIQNDIQEYFKLKCNHIWCITCYLKTMKDKINQCPIDKIYDDNFKCLKKIKNMINKKECEIYSNKIKYYCLTCQLKLCKKCINLKHKSHEIIYLLQYKKLVEKYKKFKENYKYKNKIVYKDIYDNKLGLDLLNISHYKNKLNNKNVLSNINNSIENSSFFNKYLNDSNNSLSKFKNLNFNKIKKHLKLFNTYN